MGLVQKEKRTLNKLELIKINRKARNLKFFFEQFGKRT